MSAPSVLEGPVSQAGAFPFLRSCEQTSVTFETGQAGRLIEVADGTAYNAAMGNLLLGPLGLNDTLLDHVAVLRRSYADGHVALPINGRPAVAVMTPLWLPRSTDPAGGIWTTTRDVLRYGRFHLAAGTIAGPANIVSPNSLRRMQEPAMPIPGTSLQIGRDWFVQDVAGMRVFSHEGDTLGQHTSPSRRSSSR